MENNKENTQEVTCYGVYYKETNLPIVTSDGDESWRKPMIFEHEDAAKFFARRQNIYCVKKVKITVIE